MRCFPPRNPGRSKKREQVQQIPIEELFPFKEHPFKVLDDEAIWNSTARRLWPTART